MIHIFFGQVIFAVFCWHTAYTRTENCTCFAQHS